MNALDQPQNPRTDISARPTGLKWGVYGGLTAVFIGLLMYLSGSMFPDPEKGSSSSMVFGCGSVILTIVLLTMALNEYKKQLGSLEISDCVPLGFWYGIVSGAIGAAWTLLLTTVIEPDFYVKMNQSMMQMYEKMGLSEEQIVQTMDNPMVKMGQSPSASLLMQVVGGPIFAIILAVIIGLFIKKPREKF